LRSRGGFVRLFQSDQVLAERPLHQRARVSYYLFATDASTSWGMGGFFIGNYFSMSWVKLALMQQAAYFPDLTDETGTGHVSCQLLGVVRRVLLGHWPSGVNLWLAALLFCMWTAWLHYTVCVRWYSCDRTSLSAAQRGVFRHRPHTLGSSSSSLRWRPAPWSLCHCFKQLQIC
jgi:hypothetical protein